MRVGRVRVTPQRRRNEIESDRTNRVQLNSRNECTFVTGDFRHSNAVQNVKAYCEQLSVPVLKRRVRGLIRRLSGRRSEGCFHGAFGAVNSMRSNTLPAGRVVSRSWLFSKFSNNFVTCRVISIPGRESHKM